MTKGQKVNLQSQTSAVKNSRYKSGFADGNPIVAAQWGSSAPGLPVGH